jgi:hypothetical protein
LEEEYTEATTMNTTAPDILRQGIAFQHFQELIPETRATYPTNSAKMTANAKAFTKIASQLQKKTNE